MILLASAPMRPVSCSERRPIVYLQAETPLTRTVASAAQSARLEGIDASVLANFGGVLVPGLFEKVCWIEGGGVTRFSLSSDFQGLSPAPALWCPCWMEGVVLSKEAETSELMASRPASCRFVPRELGRSKFVD